MLLGLAPICATAAPDSPDTIRIYRLVPKGNTPRASKQVKAEEKSKPADKAKATDKAKAKDKAKPGGKAKKAKAAKADAPVIAPVIPAVTARDTTAIVPFADRIAAAEAAGALSIAPTAATSPYGNGFRLSYHIGQSSPDMTRAANREAMRAIVSAINSRTAAGMPTAVAITHYSGPDGINRINRYVGETRAARLARELAGETGLSPEAFIAVNGAEGWTELLNLTGSLPQFRDSAEVAAIIESDPATRTDALRALNGGAAWKHLREHIFPMMRSMLTVIVGDPAAVADVRAAQSVYATNGPAHTAAPGSVPPAAATALAKAARKAAVDNETWDMLGRESAAARWAFKTNLLYDVILAPSLEAEYMFARKWSVALEYTMPWWKNKGRDKTYQIAAVTPEVKWWFHSSHPFRGAYVGLFPGFTWYDLANGGTGHRGTGVYGGVSVGWAWKVTRTLGFEAAVGVGYMHLRYKDYEPADGHHVYQRTKSADWVGPLRAKLALVWRPWGGKPSRKNTQAKQ